MVFWMGLPPSETARTLCRAPATQQTTARSPRVPLRALVMGVAALLVALSSVALLARASASTADPIYSLASVRAALRHSQPGLLDRPLRIRAVVGVCTTWVSRCFDWQPVLVDDRRAAPVQLSWQPTPLTALRHLPLLGRFLPAPQPVRWGTRAVYRIVVYAGDATACGARPCLRAALLDADQPAG